MARGGRRDPTPGTAYPQRTDLNRKLPVTASPSEQYGQRTSIEQAQRAVPMSAPTAPPAGAPGGPVQAASEFPFPQTQPFTRPSERPGEPVTAGLPTGPGPGPESLGPGDGDWTNAALRWAAYLPALEMLASQPSASQVTRDFVRRLRANLPSK